MSQTPNPMQRKSVLPEFLKNMFGGQGQQDGPMTPQTSPNLGMGANIGASAMTPPMFPPQGGEKMGMGQGMGQGAKAASKQDPMDAMSFQQHGMDPRKRFLGRSMMMP